MQLDIFKDKPNGKKNVITFLIGSICWILLASYLFSPNIIHTNFLSITLKNFFQWFIVIDICAIAIIYKMYYNKSIFNEIVEIADVEPVTEKITEKVEPVTEKKLKRQRKKF